MRTTHDVLVLGHGLAGAVLSVTLQRRGLRVHVFDRKRPGNASMAAAGIVNPLVLRRDVLSWGAADMLPEAVAFYTGIDRTIGSSYWHPMSLVKLFPTQAEVAQWERAMLHEGTSPYIDQRPQPQIDAAPLRIPHGHGTVHAAAWFDVVAFLASERRRLLAEGAFTEVDVEETSIECVAGVHRIGALSAPWIIRCAGAFGAVPGLVPVKGEVLTVRIPDLDLPCMVHRGVFVLPLGAGLYRVGATFVWEDVWSGPSGKARQWLLDKLRSLTDAPVEVMDHWCGVRPASRDRRPILGVVRPGEAVFNGLGSRGVLLAPWCARHLVQHLFDGMPLDPEVDVARFADSI